VNESYISRPAVIACVLWAVTLSLVVTVWALALVDHASPQYHRGLSVLAVVSANVASVWQVRLYVLRLSGLIRVANGLESPDAALHTLGRT
jgi:hypothetical protein